MNQPPEVLQRYIWTGEPRDLGDCFHLVKGERAAVCRLFTHQFGWELRLEVSPNHLARTQVCRTQDEVLDTFETWKVALIEKGWN